MRGLLFVLIAASATAGCGLVYNHTTTPWAYRSATNVDVKSSPSDPAVRGSACAYSLLYLVAWGDYGYAKAARDAMKSAPESQIYDVSVDVQVNSYVLGLYTRVCTYMTGKAGKV